jgi:hypothetical protein
MARVGISRIAFVRANFSRPFTRNEPYKADSSPDTDRL